LWYASCQCRLGVKFFVILLPLLLWCYCYYYYCH
jgi:hypothetical protein